MTTDPLRRFHGQPEILIGMLAKSFDGLFRSSLAAPKQSAIVRIVARPMRKLIKVLTDESSSTASS